MRCPHCASSATAERPDRTELGDQRFRCRDCQREFNERTGTPFNRRQYPTDLVCLVVFWRFQYKLSLRDLVVFPVPCHGSRRPPRGRAAQRYTRSRGGRGFLSVGMGRDPGLVPIAVISQPTPLTPPTPPHPSGPICPVDGHDGGSLTRVLSAHQPSLTLVLRQLAQPDQGYVSCR